MIVGFTTIVESSVKHHNPNSNPLVTKNAYVDSRFSA